MASTAQRRIKRLRAALSLTIVLIGCSGAPVSTPDPTMPAATQSASPLPFRDASPPSPMAPPASTPTASATTGTVPLGPAPHGRDRVRSIRARAVLKTGYVGTYLLAAGVGSTETLVPINLAWDGLVPLWSPEGSRLAV